MKKLIILSLVVLFSTAGLGADLYVESFEYADEAALDAEWPNTATWGWPNDGTLNTTYASDGAKSLELSGAGNGAFVTHFLPSDIALTDATLTWQEYVDTGGGTVPHNSFELKASAGFSGSLYYPNFASGDYTASYYQGSPLPDTSLGLALNEGWNDLAIIIDGAGGISFRVNGVLSTHTIAGGYWKGVSKISMFDWAQTGSSGIVDNIRIYDGGWQPPGTIMAKISEVGADPCAPDIRVTEGNPGAPVTDTYEVVLVAAPPAGSTVTVEAYADPNDPAQITLSPGSGGVGNLLNVSFNDSNWDTPQTVTVTTIDDTVGVAAQRTVGLSHSLVVTPDPCEATDPCWVSPLVENGSLVVTIIEDDEFRGLDVSPLSVSVIETGPTTDTFTVALKSEPGTPSSLDVDITPLLGQVDVSPSTLTFTNSDWDTAQTVTVTAIDDALGEDDPHAGSVGLSVPLDVSWNPTAAFSDTFEDSDASAWGFVPTAPDVNALEEGTSTLDVSNGGVLMPKGGIAVSPYDIDPCSPYYRVTTQVDMRLSGNAVSHVQIYLRADPAETIWEWHGVRVEYFSGGLSIISTGIQPAIPQSPVLPSWDPCSVYEIVITDLNNRVTASITEVGNPLNTVSTTAIDDLSIYGKGSKIMLGRDLGSYTEYTDHLMFKVEEPLTEPTPDQIDWAKLSETVAVSVGDNDCTQARSDTLVFDYDDDCDYDLVDFAAAAADWLVCTKPNDGVCD